MWNMLCRADRWPIAVILIAWKGRTGGGGGGGTKLSLLVATTPPTFLSPLGAEGLSNLNRCHKFLDTSTGLKPISVSPVILWMRLELSYWIVQQKCEWLISTASLALKLTHRFLNGRVFSKWDAARMTQMAAFAMNGAAASHYVWKATPQTFTNEVIAAVGLIELLSSGGLKVRESSGMWFTA